MAFLQCSFFSDVLGLHSSMNVILPRRAERQIGQESAAPADRYPVLWLLHGLSDDHTVWARRTSVERYVAPLGLAVVMPAVGRSYYCDMAHGGRYWEFISEELPAVAREFFPLSDDPADNFVAGLSMGGFGAFKLALNHPERFGAAGSFSGAVDMRARVQQVEDEHVELVDCVMGNGPFRECNDLPALLRRRVKEGAALPPLYQSCGTEDFLYEDNQHFRRVADKLGVDLTTDFRPGEHNWDFWDTDIQRFLHWLPLAGPQE
jgi:S-formylglutathione hydrolase FrmB